MDKTFSQNKLMLLFATIFSASAIIIWAIHRFTSIFETQVILRGGHLNTIQTSHIVLVMLFLLIVLNIISWSLYHKHTQHKYLPLFITLTLTWSSITAIAAGDGLVEYHFSIFVVMSLIILFHTQQLLFTASAIFVVHHLGGYFSYPELICGVHDYSFSLLIIHAVYLILITVTAAVIIHYTNRANTRHELKQQQSNEKIKMLLQQLQAVSDNVQESTIQLGNKTANVSVAGTTIQRSIAETKQNIDTTTAIVQKTNDTTMMLEQQMDNMQTITHSIAQQATNAASYAQNGSSSVHKLLQQNSSMEHSLQNLQTLIQQLHIYSQNIYGEVGEIEQISDQTKLLALNASIEAARAGEHGAGFNVVAQEVQKLANHSKQSTQSIFELIQAIHTSVKNIQQSMETTIVEMTKGKKIAGETNNSFTNIVHNSQRIASEIDNISSIIDQAVQTVQTVTTTFNVILNSNQELLDSAEHSLDSSQLQLHHMQDLQHVATTLTEVTDKLQQLMRSEHLQQL